MDNRNAKARRHRPARHAIWTPATARTAGRRGGRPCRSASTRTCWSTGSSCSTSRRTSKLAELVAERHRLVSPETEVRHAPGRLRTTRGTSRRSTPRCTTSPGRYPFDPEHEEYLVHITTGTHVAQICLFLLTESRHLPGKLLQTSPAAGDSSKTRSGSLSDHRPGPVEVRPPRLALRAGADRKRLSFLKSGIDTRNAEFNRLIERIEQVAIAQRAPMLLTGPTGAGKSQLARRIYELKTAAAADRRPVRRGQLRHAPRRRGDVGAVRPREGRVHRRRRRTGPACCGQPTAACCFSTRSASWASTSRPCCCGPGGEALPAGRRGRGGAERLPADRRHQPRPGRARWHAGGSARTCWPASTCGPSGCPAFPRAARTSSRTSTTSWTSTRPARGSRSRSTRRPAGGSSTSPCPSGRVAGQLPRPQRRRHAHGDAGPGRPDQRRDRRRGDRATGGRLEKFDAGRKREACWPRSLGPRRWPSWTGSTACSLPRRSASAVSSKTLSEAGRRLFGVSRTLKKSPNDADRLRKYLSRFGLSWDDLHDLPQD